MDYKERYEKALGRARSMYESKDDAELAAFIFPELRESEDERIRKDIVAHYEIMKEKALFDNQVGTAEIVKVCDDALAYLEKQKERGRNITANLLEDGITGVQRELIEFLANNIDAPWVDVIKSADAYAQRIRSMVEKQKEPNTRQRLAEWSKTEEGKAKYEEVAKEMRDEMEEAEHIDAIKRAALVLVDSVEKYVRQECSRSTLLSMKDKLKELLEK